MYPAVNDMDGCYHQVKRENKVVKLTDEERILVANDYDDEAMLRLAGELADRLHRLAYHLHRARNIIRKFGEEMFRFADEEADPE